MYSYVSVLFLCTFVYICLLMFVSVYSCYVRMFADCLFLCTLVCLLIVAVYLDC